MTDLAVLTVDISNVQVFSMYHFSSAKFPLSLKTYENPSIS